MVVPLRKHQRQQPNLIHQLHVVADPPSAGFTASPTSGYAPLTVAFTNTTSGEVTGYTWTFGDGATSTLTKPLHVYTQTGVYTVALTVEVVTETHTLTRTNCVTVTSGGGYKITTRAITYTYDSLNRLTGADYSSGESFEYAYDAVGNRTALTSVTPLSGTVVTTYTFDAANRLTDRGVSDGRVYTYLTRRRSRGCFGIGDKGGRANGGYLMGPNSLRLMPSSRMTARTVPGAKSLEPQSGTEATFPVVGLCQM